MRGIPDLFILFFIFGNIGIVSTQDYNYDDYKFDNYYEYYVDNYMDVQGCYWTEHFCVSTHSCQNASEACDGQCGRQHHFCPSKSVCLHDSEACDGQCTDKYYGRIFRFCLSSGTCIEEHTACDGMCPDNRPNICDNGTFCYPDYNINNHNFDCKDKSDEYRPIGEPCTGFYRFCPSNSLCLNESEACNGQCQTNYHFSNYSNSCIYCNPPDHFCITTGSCIPSYSLESCDGQCKEDKHFCPATNTCMDKKIACDGNCPDDRPNFCDGKYCYPKEYINNREYNCMDRSDEHWYKEESPPLNNSSVDKFLKLNIIEFKSSFSSVQYPGVDCQDGTMHSYTKWCREKYSRICGGVSTTDYFICHNSSLWRDRPCEGGYVRGCKVPGICIAVDYHIGFECDGQVGDYITECGHSDYSDERCSVNKKNLWDYKRYFRCKDDSYLIHPTLVCDGFKYCADLSDENACDICPRVNNMMVHSQEVHLMTEEMRDFAHLKSSAIMKCESPYGQPICATPGDGIPECLFELKDGLWQTQDEVELRNFMEDNIKIHVLYFPNECDSSFKTHTTRLPLPKAYR